MEFYTYTYIDPERHVPIYVGKGHGGRAFDHLRSKKNKRFANRLKTLSRKGLEPSIEIHPALSEDAAFDEEKRLIKVYGRRDMGTGTLYNLTDGGEGACGHVKSPETLEKLAASVKASYTPALRELRRQQFTGQVFSDSARQKMSEAKLGTKRSAESKAKQGRSISGENHHAAKTWQLQSPDGELFTTKSISAFCQQHGLAYSALRNRARDKSKVPIGRGPSEGWIVISSKI
jgi:hypothetical protein